MDSTEDDHREASGPAEQLPSQADAQQPGPAASAQTPSQESPASAETQPQESPAVPKAGPRRPDAEEALAAMRRDLREEAQQEQARTGAFARLMQRLFRRRKAPVAEVVEPPSPLDGLEFPEPRPVPGPPPVEPASTGTARQEPAAPPTAEGRTGFEALVRTRLTEAFPDQSREPLEVPPAAPPPEEEHAPAAPGQSILSTLRQGEQAVSEQPTDFRQEALEDYVIAPEEAEQAGGAPLTRRLKRSWRYMGRGERRLLIGALGIIVLAMLGGGGFLVVKSIPAPTPAVTPTTRLEPVPISVSLPGGWVFPLNIGFVDNGQWNPRGAEWLSGTEVCRWVSLPWTVQLEAVLRTLKANDEIKLSMSNYDSLVYKVQSIEQVPSSGISKLASDSPCLLLILSKEDTSERWVVTAKP